MNEQIVHEEQESLLISNADHCVSLNLLTSTSLLLRPILLSFAVMRMLYPIVKYHLIIESWPT